MTNSFKPPCHPQLQLFVSKVHVALPARTYGARINLRSALTSGPNPFSTIINSSAAASRFPSEHGSNASRMNSTLVVSTLIPVLAHCRQFHLLHVTPASSHHTTSPAGGYSVTFSPADVVSNASLPVARTSTGAPVYLSRSSPPKGIWYFTLSALYMSVRRFTRGKPLSARRIRDSRLQRSFLGFAPKDL